LTGVLSVVSDDACGTGTGAEGAAGRMIEAAGAREEVIRIVFVTGTSDGAVGSFDAATGAGRDAGAGRDTDVEIWPFTFCKR
jgi:hypothetical protein